MSTRTKVLHYGSWLSLVVSFVLTIGAFYFYVLHIPTPIVVYGDQKITPNPVTTNGVITVVGEFEKFTDAPGVIYARYICNGQIYPAEEVISTRGKTDAITQSSFRVRIPSTIPADVSCVRDVRADYKVNLLAERTAFWQSQPFSVVANGGN